MIKNILTYPNPTLKKVSKEVTKIDDKIKAVINNLFDTMYASDNGCGLAAPQIGSLYRITVIDVSEDKSEKMCLINPKIIKKEGEFKGMEGCLSFPGVFEKVKRFETITFEAMNENGETYQKECDGLLAECVQHEIDHLDGILFIDKMSPLRRNRLLTKYKKIEKVKV